jgi:RimJ/RimL family protein N-acetyltransferase
MNLSSERLLLRPVAYDDFGRPTQWQIVERSTGATLGSIGFHGLEGEAVLVGYELTNERRGQGLATEALSAVLAHVAASGQADRVIAETELDHVASRRVMEKAGMQLREVVGARVRYAYDCAVRSAP